MPVLKKQKKKKGNYLYFERNENHFKRNGFLDFRLPEATFKIPTKEHF